MTASASDGPPPLTDYAAVLVDLDGTLVDSEAPVRRAWAAFAARHDLDLEQVLHFAQGRPSRETAARLAPDADLATEAALLERSETSDTEGLTALPGARALLSGPLTLAIVTSCTRRLALVRLRGCDLPVPAVMVCSDDVSAGKPDPEPYRIGAQRLGVDPGACVALEDAPAGIASATAAGAAVIAVRTTHADAELVGADAIVDTVAALVPGS
jgi:sugar-phosphatase